MKNLIKHIELAFTALDVEFNVDYQVESTSNSVILTHVETGKKYKLSISELK